MKKIIPMLFMVAGSFPILTHAASCDQLRDHINNASGLLNKAQQAKSFDDAKRGMNNAKYAINEVAEDARSCPCVEAADLFDGAATKIRRASDADVVGKYNDFVRLGVEGYGAAIDALNACPASQQNPDAPKNSESGEAPESVSNPADPASADSPDTP
jgi:hypothetical protein